MSLGRRFRPSAESRLATHDDTAISFVWVTRVPDGEDAVRLHESMVLDMEGWSAFDFSFGTIGSSVPEAQTTAILVMLRARADELTREPKPTSLRLHFQLSAQRRDRDRDNLGDALMPFCNELFPGVTGIRLSKGERKAGPTEWLCVSTKSVDGASMPAA